jgi:CRP-like cAMP-binding protein
VPGASVETLERVPLFEGLDAAELQAIADAMHERLFETGATVVAEGAAADGFFVIESGEAEVVAQGEPRGTLGTGDWFGEIALLMGSERTATITARTELHCYGLTPVDFRTLVEGSPAIAWKVLQSMAYRLS